jgi:uncharacterized protein
MSRAYPWGHDRRFNSYTEYFKKTFGSRVQKLTIDAGFTCPNRDGKAGTGGCTYCDNDAFNPSYCDPLKSITKQLEEGIEFHKFRYRRATSFLAYFQAYSNTYAPLDNLKELYTTALTYPGVIGLVIGTRPDCVDEGILDYLADLSQKAFVVVEYGIESCYDKTLFRINRGHDYEKSVWAINESSKRGILSGAHMIIGLPGETEEEILAEADLLSELPLHSLKFHQLQIIKGTAMEREYREKPSDFRLFEMDEYLNLMMKMIGKLNPGFVIERIAGEVPPAYHYNKNWTLRYDEVLRRFEKLLEDNDTWQGKYYRY